ncbi:mitotic checkpoint serine/threonine-protein kinase BUB1 [Lepisosteus oculatus]|uniref:mitotic checkpoint serine/threonine-protein kinase BUB1 n=1 Tax=Lepisosteus oculatus TaxID=7918 RepID=UPI0035F51504
MDIGASLQQFEASVRSYTGDDPLELWMRYISHLDDTAPSEERTISHVLNRLVENFFHDKRYHDDIRYVKSCIRCSRFYKDPLQLLHYLYDHGIGTKAAHLYTSWASELERQGQLKQADTLLQRAVEMKAEPAQLLQDYYGKFQARVLQRRTEAQGGPRPLQNLQLVNQMEQPRLPKGLAACSQSKDCKPEACQDLYKGQAAFPVDKTEHIISKSENTALDQRNRGAGKSVQECAMYCKNDLVCGDSELSFEELRARRYFYKCKLQEEKRQLEECHARKKTVEPQCTQFQIESETAREMNSRLSSAQGLGSTSHQQQGPAIWEQQQKASLEPELAQQPCRQPGSAPLPDSVLTWAEQGQNARGPESTHLPSLLLGSFRVGTEGLAASDRQGRPAELLQQRFAASLSEASRAPLRPVRAAEPRDDSPPLSLPCRPVPAAGTRHSFLSADSMGSRNPPGLQDEDCGCPSRENRTYLNPAAGPRPTSFQQQSYREQDVSKTEDKVERTEATGNVSLGGNGTVPHVTPNTSLGLIQATPSRVQPSPTVHTKEALDVIMDMFQAPALSLTDDGLHDKTDESFEAFCRNTSDYRAQQVLPPNVAPAAAPFSVFQEDSDQENKCVAQKLDKTNSAAGLREHPGLKTVPSTQNGAAPVAESAMEDYTVWAARCNNTLAACPNTTRDFALSAQIASTPFHSRASLPWDTQDTQGLDASEENLYQLHKTRKLSPITEQSPSTEEDLPSQCAAGSRRRSVNASSGITAEGPEDRHSKLVSSLSEHKQLALQPAVPQEGENQLSHPPSGDPAHVVPDPWDETLIKRLLSDLPTPLHTSSNFFTWKRNTPSISPKMTVTVGDAPYQIDCVLGEGAFATVYQVSGLSKAKKLVFKVLKSTSPWEFYIDRQLNERLQPSVRHLYNSLCSAHIFQNGSILMGELYSCGTLLNAVNLYRNLSEKVMPQPLVIYLSICILHMVEQLHSIGMIHADIKPDNFMLGERFLENECFDPENLEHGLSLIDFGQSIDMTLFKEGTVFKAKCMTSGFQCVEMLMGRPWTYQTDYFGIAGTVYCMIFGTYMKVKNENGVWKPNTVFKRNPHSEMWTEFFHTLLNVPDCNSLPSLKSLRDKLTAVFLQNYSTKIRALRTRLIVLLLESKRSRK